MGSIKNTAGTLAPPACYASEQARFEAYIAALISVFQGGNQWEDGQTSPVDLDLYWLKTDTNGRSRSIRKYSVADGKWIPVADIPFIAETSGGAADAYTITNTPALSSDTVFSFGRRFYFVSSATNTGATTLNVDGLGAKPITRHSGAALQAGDIVTDMVVDVIYNTSGGGRFEIQTPLPPITGVAITWETTTTFAIPAAGSKVEVSHGLTKAPALVRVVAVCNTGVDGYSVGDEIDITGIAADLNAGDEDAPAYVVSCSSDKITVSAQVANNGQNYVAKTGGVADWDLSSSNFTFKAYMAAFP